MEQFCTLIRTIFSLKSTHCAGPFSTPFTTSGLGFEFFELEVFGTLGTRSELEVVWISRFGS